MSAIQHHIPEAMLLAYAAGNLDGPFSLVVASHISVCDECRARYEAHLMAGGALVEAASSNQISDDLRASTLALLDRPAPAEPRRRKRSGIFPGPVMEALGGQPPRWQRLGRGVRQSVLSRSGKGSVRLLYIPPGQAMPDHGHKGSELTMVLQGAFRDEGGRYGVGDVEVADSDLEHTPIAEAGEPCICLAATDEALRFTGLIPRMLQPFIRI